MEGNTEINIFNVINKVGKQLKKMELSDGLIEVLDVELQAIATYLQATKQQALIFAVIFRLNLNDENEVTGVRSISRYLEIDMGEVMVFQESINLLIERKILQREYSRSRSKMKIMHYNYHVNQVLIDAILYNAALPDLTKGEVMTIYSFVTNVSKCIDLKRRENIDKYELLELVEEIENKNGHLEIIGKLQTLNIDFFERMIIYALLDNLFQNENKTRLDGLMSSLFDDVKEKLIAINLFREKNNVLFDMEFLEIDGGDFVNECTLSLTDKAKDYFLGEDAPLFCKQVKSQNLIYPEKITLKNLFFDDELNKQISFLKKSLEQNSFNNLQTRLSEKGMTKGITAIFFGSPGTGKTESVMQIAKNTNRAVLHVDISASKSMYFSESEKKIKEIFVNYKRLCKIEVDTPILLFNEADALFQKRKENGSSNTQATENAIQAILLEELENFEGILIATTNLNSNLDSAFERRFLFKIKFANPSLDIKKKIWSNKLDLKDDEAHILANKFQFSGAEIENIHRKLVIESVLYNTSPDINTIIEYCSNEKFSNKNTTKIGY